MWLQQATGLSAQRGECTEHQYSSTWNGDIQQADTDCFIRPWEGRWVWASTIVHKIDLWYMCVHSQNIT